MASSSSHIASPLKQTSTINCHVTKSKDTLDAIKLLELVFASCYGPSGKLKLTQNSLGGHVTMSSSCGRLLQVLSYTNPMVKLLTSAIQGHINNYSDGGLFAGILATKLINSSLRLGHHKNLQSEIYEKLLRYSVSFLMPKNCTLKSRLDFKNLTLLMNFVKNIINKPGCCLQNKQNHDHISSIVLQAFLSSLNSEEKLHVHAAGHITPIQYLCIEGKHVKDSQVLNGILYQLTKMTDLKFVTECLEKKKGFKLKIGIFRVSLAGDSSEILNVHYEKSTTMDTSAILIHQIEYLAQQAVNAKLDVLACQKVVHPRVKKMLQVHDIIVIDRLGLVQLQMLERMTGVISVGSLYHTLSAENIGFLSKASVQNIGGRQYLYMESTESSVCTVVLCNRHQEALEELKYACKSANHALELALQDPSVLCGGGLWQILLAQYIETQVSVQKHALAEEFHCSPQQILAISHVYTQALESIGRLCTVRGTGLASDLEGLTDLAKNGKWEKIGEELKKHTVWDSFPIAVSALKTAIFTTGLVLKIGNFIHDKN